MKNRIIAFLTLILTLFVCQNSSSASENADNTIQAAKMLSALGIYKPPSGTDISDIDFSYNITRGDFTSLAVNAIGIDTSSYENQPFSDVSASDKNFKNISFAYGAGIINGYSDKTFKPDETIRYSEGLKILVSTLGYGEYTERKGGWSVGYLQEAARLSITIQGIALDAELNIGQALTLLCGAVRAPVLDVVALEKGEARFSAQKNVTLLSKYRNIYRSSGKITGNGLTRIDSEADMRSGELEIDRIVYKNDYAGADDYLGYICDIYYFDDGNQTIIKYVAPRSSNKTLVINTDNFIKYGGNNFTYEVNDKQRDVKIANGADVIYNGGVYARYTSELFDNIKTGEVILLDADDDNIYETIFIKAYENYVVNAVNLKEKIIYDKYFKRQLELDTVDTVSLKIFASDGKELTLENISDGDLLSVYASKGGKIIKIIKSQKSVGGEVAAVFSEDGYTYITLDGQTYRIAKSYIDGNQLPLKPGIDENFLIDVNGDIAAVSTVISGQSDAKYAFIIGAAMKNTLGDILNLKLYTYSDTVKIVTLAARVTIDGENYTNGAKVWDFLTDKNKLADFSITEINDNTAAKMLVRYKLNDKDELYWLDTPYMNDKSETESDSLYMTADLKTRYRSYSRTFWGKADTADQTYIFFVPKPEDAEDDTKYMVRKQSSLLNDREYTIKAFQANSDTYASDAVVVTGDSQDTITEEVGLAVVSKITSGLDDNDEPVKRLKVMREKRIVEVDVGSDKEELLAGLKEGMVIRYTVDSKEKLSALNLIYNPEEKDDDGNVGAAGFVGFAQNPSDLTNYNQYARFTYGEVYGRRNGIVKVYPVQKGEVINFSGLKDNSEKYKKLEGFDLQTASIIVYDRNLGANRVYSGNLSGITDWLRTGDPVKILVHTRYSQVISAVVIK